MTQPSDHLPPAEPGTAIQMGQVPDGAWIFRIEPGTTLHLEPESVFEIRSAEQFHVTLKRVNPTAPRPSD